VTVSVYHTNVLVAIFTNLAQKIFKLQKPNDSHSTGYKEDPDEDFEITVKTE